MRSCFVSAAAIGVLCAATTGVHAQLVLVDFIPGNFIDISLTGNALNIGGDDEAEITTTVGNMVFPAGRVIVGNNGGVAFNPGPSDSDQLGPLNGPIPDPGAFGGDQSALPYWDDIGNTLGNVYWEEVATELTQTLIIQWHNHRFEGSTDTARFQLQIRENDLTVFAQFIYDDIMQPRASGGASATIGYQNGLAPFNDAQWSFNTPFAVHNDSVLSLIRIPTPGSLGVLAAAGLMAARRRR